MDDDPDFLASLARVLENAGFRDLLLAQTVQQAFQHLGLVPEPVFAPRIDLMILDLGLPVLSGLEVLRQIKATPSLEDIPVLMVTGSDDQADLQEAFAAGAMDYVIKPFRVPELLARVRSAVRLKREMDRRKSRERELEIAHGDLSRLYDGLRSGLVAAGRVQHGLLPPPSPSFGGVQAEWRFEPCENVGGDLLDVFPFANGEIGFFTLDVSGHGIPAALMAVSLSRLLEPVSPEASPTLEPDGTPRAPSEVLGLLNRQFQVADAHAQYFTILYGILDPRSGRLRYARAGHPPPLVLAPGAAPKLWEEGDVPVGWLADARYLDIEKTLAPGSRLVFVSDGVTEALRDGGFEMFGMERVIRTFDEGRGLVLDAVASRLLDDLHAFQGGPRPKDDVTLLAIEFVGDSR